jgi:hypothetical protein
VGDYLEDLGVDGRIILKWVFKKRNGEAWSGSGNGQVAGACECDNKPSGSLKCGEFLD